MPHRTQQFAVGSSTGEIEAFEALTTPDTPRRMRLVLYLWAPNGNSMQREITVNMGADEVLTWARYLHEQAAVVMAQEEGENRLQPWGEVFPIDTYATLETSPPAVETDHDQFMTPEEITSLGEAINAALQTTTTTVHNSTTATLNNLPTNQP